MHTFNQFETWKLKFFQVSCSCLTTNKKNICPPSKKVVKKKNEIPWKTAFYLQFYEPQLFLPNKLKIICNIPPVWQIEV